MKKTCILLLLFLSCVGTGWAQQKDVDEMIKKLEAARSFLNKDCRNTAFGSGAPGGHRCFSIVFANFAAL